MAPLRAGRGTTHTDSISRRRFLRDGTLGLTTMAVAAPWSRRALADPLGLPIGLELYTVRNEAAKDFDGTMRQVAAIGYKEVELPNTLFGRTVSHVRETFQALGLVCPAAHYETPQLRTGLDRRIADAKELGLGYMICAFLRPHERQSLDDYRRVADFFNQVGEQIQRAGLQFAYHGHNFEFTTFDGAVAYDELIRRTDPKLVIFELDCYWVTRAGKDPVAYFKQYPGRFPILHIKDMKPGHAPTTDLDKGADAFTEVGRGSIDWKRIFAAAPAAGVKHYFVEQDKCDGPPIESARISYDYLHSLHV